MDERLAAFNLFRQARRTELQQIANSTSGEQELDDVVGQAWIIADDMITAGVMADMGDTQFQDRLILKLRRYFQDSSSYIRRRRTTRLDVNEYDADSLQPHPLMRVLVSDSPDPLMYILDKEEVKDEVKPSEIEIEGVYSLAGAYGKLLDFFDRNIRKLAEHLRISIARTRRRCEYVTLLAFHQRPLPYPLPGDFVPAPWYSRTLQRRPRQLMLEFSYQLEFKY
jgi:hypothetical protein